MDRLGGLKVYVDVQIFYIDRLFRLAYQVKLDASELGIIQYAMVKTA